VLRAKLLDTLAFEADLFGTLGAYRTMVLRHVQWLDTGDAAAYDAWRSAERRYVTARAAHVTRYGGDVDLPAFNFTAADLGATRADRDPLMAWLARALLALLLTVLAAGALGRRRWPALHALWVGATRPWRLAHLRGPAEAAPSRAARAVLIGVPAVALMASRLVYTWFAAPAHLLLTLGAWLLFAATARLLLGRRDPFLLWAAIGGVALLRTVLLLAVLAVRGPGHYWLEFWTAPAARSAYICVAFAAFGWLFVATALVLRDHHGLRRRHTTGTLLITAGVPLGLLGALITAVGLERALTVWNDQLALLPWGLSRILGITVDLGIPTTLPGAATAAGLLLIALGAALRTWRRSRPPTEPTEPAHPAPAIPA
jgi:hypothetical protein